MTYPNNKINKLISFARRNKLIDFKLTHKAYGPLYSRQRWSSKNKIKFTTDSSSMPLGWYRAYYVYVERKL
jgi:hypothetical protein